MESLRPVPTARDPVPPAAADRGAARPPSAWDDIEDLRRRRQAALDGPDPFGPEMKRRAVFWASAGGVLVPVLSALFSAAGLALLPVQVLIGATYGLFVAYRRPGGILSAALLAAGGALAMIVSGHGRLVSWVGLLMFMAFGGVGAVIGIAQTVKASDGE